MTRIFISYRRDDSAGYVGWIYDRLVKLYDASQIFRDIRTIEPGEDFVEVIESAVGTCEVLLAVIGKQWATITDSAGRRRLDDPNDFVRLEIATALRRGIRVIPLLVGGASMPRAGDLPDDLARLARLNALTLGDKTFDHDMGELVAALHKVLGPPNTVDYRLRRLFDQPEAEVIRVLGVPEEINGVDSRVPGVLTNKVLVYRSQGFAVGLRGPGVGELIFHMIDAGSPQQQAYPHEVLPGLRVGMTRGAIERQFGPAEINDKLPFPSLPHRYRDLLPGFNVTIFYDKGRGPDVRALIVALERP